MLNALNGFRSSDIGSRTLNFYKGEQDSQIGCRKFDAFWVFQIFPFGPPCELMKIKVV